jgi:hypothetical protein
MSTILETIADDFARDVLAAAEETGDEGIVDQVSKAIGQSSPTFQEAFNTAIRMRRAERRGREALAAALKARR